GGLNPGPIPGTATFLLARARHRRPGSGGGVHGLGYAARISQARRRRDDDVSAVRCRRPAAQVGVTTLLASVCLAVLAPSAFAKAPAFHQDTTPLPSSLSETTTTSSSGAHATSTGGELARTVAGLAIVLAVLFGIYWLFKTYAKGKQTKSDGRLEIVA